MALLCNVSATQRVVCPACQSSVQPSSVLHCDKQPCTASFVGGYGWLNCNLLSLHLPVSMHGEPADTLHTDHDTHCLLLLHCSNHQHLHLAGVNSAFLRDSHT